MCHPNRLTYHQKSLDMGPTLVKKIFRKDPISQNCEKIGKNSCLWGRKPLRNGSQFAKISKKIIKSAFCGRKKWVNMGKGFRHRAAHLSKNNLSMRGRAGIHTNVLFPSVQSRGSQYFLAGREGLKGQRQFKDKLKQMPMGGGGYLVERWIWGCAAQIVCLFGLSGLPMAFFYLKIGLDIGRVFAKCLIFRWIFPLVYLS